MRRFGLALLLAVVLAVPAHIGAQGAPSAAPSAERDAVQRAVLDYVEGFYEGDSTKHARSIAPDVFKYGYYVPRDSARYVGEQMTRRQFDEYTARWRTANRRAPATAPKEIAIYDVLDQTASAKLTAYWGVDYLLLAKREGRWMVTHVLWQTPPKK